MHEVTIGWDRPAERGVVETVERPVTWALVALLWVLFLVVTVDKYAPPEVPPSVATTTKSSVP